MATASRLRVRRAKRLPKPFKSVDTVPVSVVQLAERYTDCTAGMLTFSLTEGVMDDYHVPLAEGRPTFRLDLEFDFPNDDDEWRYVDSQALTEGVAGFLHRMRKRLQNVIDDLMSEPGFERAWKGGGK